MIPSKCPACGALVATSSWSSPISAPDDVLVRVSPEILDELVEDWSPPVQVRVERSDDGTYQMIARRLDT